MPTAYRPIERKVSIKISLGTELGSKIGFPENSSTHNAQGQAKRKSLRAISEQEPSFQSKRISFFSVFEIFVGCKIIIHSNYRCNLSMQTHCSKQSPKVHTPPDLQF